MKLKNHKNFQKFLNLGQTGFTLMEMITAVAIFIVVILIVTNIFLIASRQQRYVAGAQKVQSDARFAMELLSREIRMAKVDLDYYIDNYGLQWFYSNPTEELVLRDINGSLLVFSADYSGLHCPNEESIPCLVLGEDTDDDGNIDQWNSITPAGIKLLNLRFYIHPNFSSSTAYDEYCDSFFCSGSYTPFQHAVVIALATRTTEPLPGNEIPEVVYLQTSVTSRTYMK